MPRFFPRFTAAALCVLATRAVAQEIIPPGAKALDRPESRQAGRLGERILRPGGLLDRLGERLADAGEELDVAKLEVAIDSLLAPLAENSPLLDDLWFDLRADQTDFANDKLGVSAGLVVRKTPWSPNPTRLAVDLAGQLADSESGRRELRVRASLELDTAVLPLVNFALPRLRNKLAASAEQAPEGADREFLLGLREELANVDSVRSIDELADLFAKMSALRLASWNREVDRRREDLAAASTDDERRLATASLLQGRLERDRLFAARPRIERDVYGAARELHVSIENTAPTDGLHVEVLELVISADGVRATAEMAVGKGVELYELTRPLALGMLRRLQNGDPATVAIVREVLVQRLAQAEKAMLAPADSPEAR